MSTRKTQGDNRENALHRQLDRLIMEAQQPPRQLCRTEQSKARVETLLRKFCLLYPDWADRLGPILGDLQALNLVKLVDFGTGDPTVLDESAHDRFIDLAKIASELMSTSIRDTRKPDRFKILRKTLREAMDHANHSDN